jgi:hypothetical protein
LRALREGFVGFSGISVVGIEDGGEGVVDAADDCGAGDAVFFVADELLSRRQLVSLMAPRMEPPISSA